MVLRLALSFILLATLNLQAQINQDQALEPYLENAETQADYTQITEDISTYIKQPLRINSADIDELLRFPLLSNSAAIAITEHRNQFGPFDGPAELQVIGMSPSEIKQLLPFISFAKTAAMKLDDWKSAAGFHQFQAVYTTKFKTPSALPAEVSGPDYSENMRLRFHSGNLFSMGLNAERDAGEMRWNKGPDFYSAHLAVGDLGYLKQFIIGDYVAGFGQGLVMGAGIGMGKSSLVLNTRRNFNGLKPYRGINEYLFLRGSTATFQFRKTEISVFAARNRIDSRISADSTGISNPDTDGYHRTAGELSTRWNQSRTAGGIFALSRNRRGHWGIGITKLRFSDSVAFDGLYRLHYPGGQNRTFVNIFQSHTLGRNHWFGEWAVQIENQSQSMVLGWLSSLGNRTELSFLFRKYDPGFSSPFSTAFGNAPQNETGFYSGIKWHISRLVKLSVYADLWQNPWLKYRVWQPSRGSESFAQLEYQPARKTQIYLRQRLTAKPFGITDSEPTKYAAEMVGTQTRIHLSTEFNQKISMQIRGETSLVKVENFSNQASLVFIQFRSNGRIRMTARYTMFQAPWYYNRLYAFESQLPYEFSSVAFYGTGYHCYLLAQTHINKRWHAGLRAALTKTQTSGTIDRSSQSLFLQLKYEY